MKKLKINYIQSINWKSLSPGKKALYTTLSIAIALTFFVIIILSLPKIYLNNFLKNQIIDSFAKAHPEYSLKINDVNLNILKNRAECNSISLTKIDSTFSCRIGAFSIDGIDWINLFLEKKISPKSISGATLDAKDISLYLNRLRYKILCGQLHLSVPDSEIQANTLEVRPLISDEPFFTESKFRNARYSLIIPKLSVNGIVLQGLFNGNKYCVRSIKTQDASIDILVNMDKSFDTKSPNPLMPNVVLSSIIDTIRVDSLQVMNSRLNYCERYAVNAKAASITFDRIQFFTEGIVNHTGRPDTIAIHAQANFMNSSTMKLLMLIPLGSPQSSFSFAGSLDKMEANSLNKFLEIAEHQRIKSGIVQSAAYNINVNSGQATGNVHAEYDNLSVAVLNKNTESESGLIERISSFYAKEFIIKRSNMPDKSGDERTGVVKYTRKPDEPFIQFVWFALRSGVLNLIEI